jgi:hypothetical protein
LLSLIKGQRTSKEEKQVDDGERASTSDMEKDIPTQVKRRKEEVRKSSSRLL